ncbi:hypothetical protein GC163_18885 [bacterium]|nr:hypothetical protein [bacterium]
MQLVFDCPKCLNTAAVAVEETTSAVDCPNCSWSRTIGPADRVQGSPQRCLVCGCDDLWRQKDFPILLGLVMVGTGVISSSIAIYYYQPVLSMVILMGFALIDMLLFLVMPDCLVCYRCHARFRGTGVVNPDHHPKFDLELNERYRQEAARLQGAPPSASHPST